MPVRARPPADVPIRDVARLPDEGRRRAVIAAVRPAIDGGRFPIKRTPGEPVHVEADVFADGHDRLAVILRHRRVSVGAGGRWHERPMEPAPNDVWRASFSPDEVGRYEFTVEAWVDHFASWQHALAARVKARQDIRPELAEGAALVRAAAGRARSALDRRWLAETAEALDAADRADDLVALALSTDLTVRMAAAPERSLATEFAPTLRVTVDRPRARVGAWYEMFPRSASPDPARSGTFREAASRLPEIAAMGFDVLYLPPIHPIGHSYRKGRNNALAAAPGDVGSPWAIGSAEGGHTAVHPELGTIEDFRWFRGEAERHGLEVALDLAYQCSPDHPYVTSHPEWFRHRPDGSIKYAENPPKKYQDIYPFDFETSAWRELWRELRDVILFWAGEGVRIFRVDNPHTKAFPFWEWVIEDAQTRDPGVIFLAEAFTRPKVMQQLAKLGFTQSYTYFTWKNSKADLEAFATEQMGAPLREYLRPNFFANTPDILHAFLQTGGPPAFRIRLVLAATLAATYGIYSGFELCEGRAVPGTEEYLDSEKYQVRQWDWDRPGHIKELVARVNAIRRAHLALHFNELRFHLTTSDHLVAYSKVAPQLTEEILTVVNIDPHAAHDGWVCLSLPGDIVPDDEAVTVRDLLTGRAYRWRGPWNYVALDPALPAHIFAVERTRA